MESYNLIFKKSVAKDLGAIPNQNVKRILDRINYLKIREQMVVSSFLCREDIEQDIEQDKTPIEQFMKPRILNLLRLKKRHTEEPFDESANCVARVFKTSVALTACMQGHSETIPMGHAQGVIIPYRDLNLC